MAKKVIKDITISPNLDFKDAEQQALAFKKKLEKNIGGDTSSKGIKLDINAKNALAQLDLLLKRIEYIKAHPTVPLDIKTDIFKEAVEDVESAQEALKEFLSDGLTNSVIDVMEGQMDRALQVLDEYPTKIRLIQARLAGLADEDIGTDVEAGLNAELAQLTEELARQQSIVDSLNESPLWQQYTELEEVLANCQDYVHDLSESGQEFELGVDPELEAAATEELNKQIDKVKVLIAQQNELKEAKSKKVEGGGEGEGGDLNLDQAVGKVGKIVGGATKFLAIAGGAIAFVTLGVKSLFSALNKLRTKIMGMIKEGFATIYNGNETFKKEVDDLKDSWDEVKANLAAAFLPIVEFAIPYIKQLIDWVNVLISKISMFVAAIFGQTQYTKAIKKTGDAAKGAAKQLSKFDELNNLSSGGGAGNDFDLEKAAIDPSILDKVEKLKALLKEIKDKFVELVGTPFMEGFSAAIGDWQGKLNTIKENIKGISNSLVEIWSNPELIKAEENYVKSFSRALGSIVGLAANIGLNIAMALTGGIDKFLEEYKGTITEDLTEMFSFGSLTFDNISQLAIDLSKIVDTIGESESLQGTISNLLGVVYNLYSAIGLVFFRLTALVSGTIAELVHNNVDKIKNALEGLFQVLETLMGFWEVVSATVKNLLIRVVDEVITPIMNTIKFLIQQVLDVLFQLWDYLQPMLLWIYSEVTKLWTEYVDPVLNDIIDLASSVAELIGIAVEWLWNNELKPVIDLIMSWMPAIMAVVKLVFDAIVFQIKTLMIILSALIKAITAVVKFVVAIIKGDWKGAWEQAKNFFYVLFIEPIKKFLDNLTEYFGKWWGGIKQLLYGILNGLVGVFEFLVNAMINLINEGLFKLVNAAISAVNAIPGVDVPTISAIQPVDWSIPLPALAQGAVIPPSMSEFIAKLGDNNQETEIVSPLSTMKQALLEALQESGGGAGEIHVHVDLDGREVAKAVVRQNDMYKKSTGRTLFA